MYGHFNKMPGHFVKMSINAIVEIALHVESFRNLDLVHQGLYKIEL